ncbi:MAG: peptidase MA family metallohydrolase [Chloroflexota bacterium]
MKRPVVHSIIILMILFLSSNSVAAQTLEKITNVQVSHTYGREILFSALFLEPESIKEIFIFFRVDDEKDPRGILVFMDSKGQINYSYDIQQNPIHPFADISYWYTLNLNNGETYNSQEYYFQYTDNRFPWQTLKNDLVEVNWYSGNMEYGKDAFEIMDRNILRISSLLSISVEEPIQLYLYATETNLQESRALGGQAKSTPQSQVLMVSIAPGIDQKADMEKQLLYELTHLLLYRKTGNASSLLPTWLREGLATQVDISTNPEYDFALANAMGKQLMISLGTLCSSFPQDPALNTLAYAQANSFISFLLKNYGQSGMEKLIQAYTGGFDCEQGVKTAFGKTLNQLENDWLQATFNNTLQQNISNILIFLFLLLLILLIPLLNIIKKQEPEGT